jgi:O-acetyl-ADP-ribose deacetylase (regulator of RNase III)
LIVIAIGLMATVAAALLANPNASAGAVALEWEQHAPLPDSRLAQLPGGGNIQLVEGGLRASGRNVSGYQLLRVAAVLSISQGAAVGSGRATCTIRVPRLRTLVTHAPGNRGVYPRPSEEEDLTKQDVPAEVVVEFNSQGTDVARVGLGDAFKRFVDEHGVTVSWAPFQIGRQGWQWGLPPGRPRRPLDLGFAAIWRTTSKPTVHVSCAVTTSAGTARVGTAGVLTGEPPPLAE